MGPGDRYVTWSEELYRIAGLDPAQPPPGYMEHQKLYTTESWALLSRAVEESLRTGTRYKLDLEMHSPPRHYAMGDRAR